MSQHDEFFEYINSGYTTKGDFINLGAAMLGEETITNAIVKVPKGKVVYIFGENVDITAKDVENKVSIYIDNGIVKLNEIKSKTIVKLYSGNVYASIKNSNIEAITKTGIIQVDSINYTKKIQKYFNENSTELSIETIKANIFLTTQ